MAYARTGVKLEDASKKYFDAFALKATNFYTPVFLHLPILEAEHQGKRIKIILCQIAYLILQYSSLRTSASQPAGFNLTPSPSPKARVALAPPLHFML
ncbi:hypothetical protein [Parasediminibacterium sp. JCM 36343]|uniref:hypothetical protein n=1 Tax=Parasediminibacterium sp. JCM 36343 TaxID=3374279 RepID=UPI003978AFEF